MVNDHNKTVMAARPNFLEVIQEKASEGGSFIYKSGVDL